MNSTPLLLSQLLLNDSREHEYDVQDLYHGVLYKAKRSCCNVLCKAENLHRDILDTTRLSLSSYWSSIHQFLPVRRYRGCEAVLQRSFWIALSRCAVQLIPMLVFCWLLILRYRIVYFGPGFSVGDHCDAFYLALLKIAAKIQELLCLASLGTVLLDALRHELLSGSGVTLGLLPSYLWFSQASYVISPEFLTALHQCFLIGWHCIGMRRKLEDNVVLCRRFWASFRLVLLLSIFIPLAVLIGPFTAVLMTPRIQYYPAGGTQYALEASAEQLWPNVVNAEAELEVCFWPNATAYAICPSGGYSSFSVRKGYKSLYDSRTFTPSLADDESSDYNLGTNFAVMEPLQILPAVLSQATSEKASGKARRLIWFSHICTLRYDCRCFYATGEVPLIVAAHDAGRS